MQTLFDADDSVEAPPVREMTVAHVAPRDCEDFARKYHYSRFAANQTWRYGIWHGATLWGIAGYNLPPSTIAASMFGATAGYSTVGHLSRLALPDHALRNSESRLIAGSLRQLQRDVPTLWAVVTYADQLEHHIGYVYQATNAIYTGLSVVKPRFITPDGLTRGTHSGSEAHGHISKEEARRRGWDVIEGKGKHRYVYLLGNKRERRERLASLRWPVLPYPKALSDPA